MQFLSFIFLSLAIFSCQFKGEKKGKVYLVKQWHLSPAVSTLNIEESKKLAPYQNQIAIYKLLIDFYEKKQTHLLIAEGCEGEINEEFKEQFNGWSIGELLKIRDDNHFIDVLAPVGLKMKVKYPQLKVLCGDNLELISENLKAMSDLRGFSGFYEKLSKYQESNPKVYQAYIDKLKSLYPNEMGSKPIEFTLKRSIDSLNLFERLLSERNQYFFNLAKKHINDNPTIVIGGLHIENLVKRFKDEGIPFEIITPDGYSSADQELIGLLKKSFAKGLRDFIKFNQVPNQFDIKKFVFKNLISKNDLSSNEEITHLEKILNDQYPMDLILSDYDNDGIRDFTISQNRELVIISAEDPDWDNDGIPNLVDVTLGDTQIAKMTELAISNLYSSKAEKKDILKKIDSRLQLINEENSSHDILVLEVFTHILKKINLNKFKLKFFNAKKAVVNYGEKVFFSYIKQSQAMEFYPQKFHEYIVNQYETKFKSVPIDKFVNSFIVPIIVHSLAHELAHAIDMDGYNILESNGWSWSIKPLHSKYLKKFRLPEKKLEELKTDIHFRGKALKKWLEIYDEYQAEIAKLLKEKQMKSIKTSSYYMQNNGKLIEHKLSFLSKLKLPSVYSLYKPDEWIAEMFSMCIYRSFYPNSKNELRSIELEHLLGINPSSASDSFCANFREYIKN